MNNAEFQLQGLGDPRLAIHAASALPAWLWSADGTRILWANHAGARMFGAGNGAGLARQPRGPADPHGRQVAQLAPKLQAGGAVRLERLRGFGAAPGMRATCACSRLNFAGGRHGVLIVAISGAGRMSPPTGNGHMTLPRVGASADFGPVAPAVGAPAFVPEAPHPAKPTASRPEGANGGTTGMTAPPATPRPTAPPATTAPPADPRHRMHSPYGEGSVHDVAPAQASTKAPSWFDEPLPNTRRHPLRFMWQMDHEGRFSLGADEFARLIGMRTAAGFGRLWSEIAESFGLDPEGRVMAAFATRDTWSGIRLNWPVDGEGHLPVELSGLPVFDGSRNFAGYRGFGVCRDVDGLARLAALRRYEAFSDRPTSKSASADIVSLPPARATARPDAPVEEPPAEAMLPANSPPAVRPTADDAVVPATPPESPEPSEAAAGQVDPTPAVETPSAEMDAPIEALGNVLPFRYPADARPPALTPVENSAFNELARQLSARLESEKLLATSDTAVGPAVDTPPASQITSEPPAGGRPEWLTEPEPPPRGEARRDRALFDLLPTGVLIYRLDRLLYANRAFLDRMGFASLHELEGAGGLDALFVEPGVPSISSTSDTGTPVRIAASHPSGAATLAADARLHTIEWDDDSALALILSDRGDETPAVADTIMAPPPEDAPSISPPPSEVGHANAEELGAILDASADGILMFDAAGNINSCNRSAEVLFGYDGNDLARHNLADLFAPESRPVVFDYLASLKEHGVASPLDHDLEVLGCGREGGLVPLSITMGRTRADGPNFFAVLRDLSQEKQSEGELREAQRLAERAASAKADMLARISHEVRTPLNAIIGFAEVMIGERFGALGNARYIEYSKDIRASGERVLAIINDLLDLSRIETGRLDLFLSHQNLNEMVESCVAVMQPQANRERIIIRTSLAHTLPLVVADARALRQITLNLIGNSIHLANAGGQVIVSTALSDLGDVTLRVRDTGQSLNDNEVAAAMEPFRMPAPSDKTIDASAVTLSLTKALVEANRARFQIRTGGRSGTLVEVVFSHAAVRA